MCAPRPRRPSPSTSSSPAPPDRHRQPVRHCNTIDVSSVCTLAPSLRILSPTARLGRASIRCLTKSHYSGQLYAMHVPYSAARRAICGQAAFQMRSEVLRKSVVASILFEADRRLPAPAIGHKLRSPSPHRQHHTPRVIPLWSVERPANDRTMWGEPSQAKFRSNEYSVRSTLSEFANRLLGTRNIIKANAMTDFFTFLARQLSTARFAVDAAIATSEASVTPGLISQ
jgi:hypothetical protein